MTATEPVEILFAEIMRNGMLITFADGTCALYSASLLHSVLPKAVKLSKEECGKFH
jgi:hypothetical protein